MYQLQVSLVRGYSPMVLISSWKAQATPCVLLATPTSAHITKRTSWKERRPCKRPDTTHTTHHTSHIRDHSAYTRPHAPKCYTPLCKERSIPQAGEDDHSGACFVLPMVCIL